MSEAALPALDLAREALRRATARNLLLATAESCTGGLIAATMTEIAGCSSAFERGYVTYSNQAKMDCLGVPAAILDAHGAVSEETARAMAEGALTHSRADAAVAVTGVAGPDGGTPEKPVGLVHLAAARHGRPTLHRVERFPGDRAAVRAATARAAFEMLVKILTD
ncbi:conserved hypothetical protein [uncultured Alphaproteobacteria bacterium]|uniref:CinA C-terminal domain-containing protein n=1 Tax=uncultured Alphaproteobacteria bacterium TaxID=91750 RepID=A0A212J7D3_9PROT|nr:conserved hypothetical protein [uncultured Alphaproteobacteria bacterium]